MEPLTARPALAVRVGYLDPGKCATDLAAGTYGVRPLPATPLFIWSHLFLAFALPFAFVPLLLLVTEDHRRRPTLTDALFLGASAVAGAGSIVLGAASTLQGFFQ